MEWQKGEGLQRPLYPQPTPPDRGDYVAENALCDKARPRRMGGSLTARSMII
jgi:hypothetical protein